jgi:hypothetical protein
MPPASPLPAVAVGEVCIDTIATRFGVLGMLPLYSATLGCGLAADDRAPARNGV